MLQHDKRKLRISGKTAVGKVPCVGGSSAVDKYSSGWHPTQLVQRSLKGDNFHGPEVHPSLGPHAAKAYPGSEQVILYMEDGKGSGVPVLGRRLPIAYKLIERPETSGELLKEQPVVGRRSHRLYHNHPHPHPHQQAHQHHLMIKSHQHYKSKCAMIMNEEPVKLAGGSRGQYRAPELSQQAPSGQQISQLKKGRPTFHQSRSSANIPAEAYQHLENGQLNWRPLPVYQPLGNAALPVRQHASRRQIPSSHHSSATAAAGGLIAPTVNLMPSSSCSSLCSAEECRSCCSPVEHEQQQVASCREPCCMANNYAISQCRRACCQPTIRESLANAGPTPAADKPSRTVRHTLTSALESPDYLYLAYEAPPQRHGRSRMAHQGGAAQRARSSHEICQQRRHLEKQEQQPMRISGRNMLPVKRRLPVYMGEDNQNKSQVDNSVSQIYESLAAELKAKLGDPRLAPILLPPKDYDTLSRRHGRLGEYDNEHRRSASSHLVQASQRSTENPVKAKQDPNDEHPKDEQLRSTSGRERSNDLAGSGKEDKQLTMKSRNECDSARSSGRMDRSPVCRSRSNSSSGLGSISMGAGSRNSSPLSSSDDMHRPSGGYGGKTGPVNNNKNYIGAGESPDDCGERFSDTKQNESGRAPSATLLRADSDYHKLQLASDGERPPHPAGSGAKTNQHRPSQASSTSGTLDAFKSRLAGKSYDGTLRWKGRVEIPLKVNSDKNGNTYLATKQIIY